MIENNSKMYYYAIKYYKGSVDADENVFAITEMGKCLMRIAELNNTPEIYFEDRDLYINKNQEQKKK